MSKKILTDLAWKDGDFVLDAAGNPTLVHGADVVAQDLEARLTCPPGENWAAPTQGVDLGRYVQAKVDDMTRLALRQEAEVGAEQDTRVLLARAELTTPDLRSGALKIGLALTDGALTEITLPLSQEKDG